MLHIENLAAFRRPDYNPLTIEETPYILRTLIRYETGIEDDNPYGFPVVYIDDMTGFMYETAESDMAVGQVILHP